MVESFHLTWGSNCGPSRFEMVNSTPRPERRKPRIWKVVGWNPFVCWMEIDRDNLKKAQSTSILLNILILHKVIKKAFLPWICCLIGWLRVVHNAITCNILWTRPPSSIFHTHTYTHTHTHIHVHTHTHTHTRAHTHTHTRAHARKHTRARTHTHTHIHTCT